MIGETTNNSTLQIPVESDFNQEDLDEYWSGYQEYPEEEQYDGTKIPDEQLDKETRESIKRVKNRNAKLGRKAFTQMLFSDAA